MTSPESLLRARCRTLEAAYAQVACTRMAGVPVLNTRLRVQAVGFRLDADDAQLAVGVLVTPWFMNLLRLPVDTARPCDALAVGLKAERDCGTQRFEFIGSHEAALGAFESASLFSPMFEFADQAAAVATAQEVLKELFPVPARVQAPARRGFLFGRSAAGTP